MVPFREPTRHIVDIQGLKNTTHHSKVTCEREIFALPKDKFSSQPLKAPIPHSNRRKNNSKRDTKVANNNTRLNKPLGCWNPCRWIMKIDNPIVSLVFIDNSP